MWAIVRSSTAYSNNMHVSNVLSFCTENLVKTYSDFIQKLHIRFLRHTEPGLYKLAQLLYSLNVVSECIYVCSLFYALLIWRLKVFFYVWCLLYFVFFSPLSFVNRNSQIVLWFQYYHFYTCFPCTNFLHMRVCIGPILYIVSLLSVSRKPDNENTNST